eukprot:scaffold11915_cov53-Cyclotella_meneghiniana.AAC.1
MFDGGVGRVGKRKTFVHRMGSQTATRDCTKGSGRTLICQCGSVFQTEPRVPADAAGFGFGTYFLWRPGGWQYCYYFGTYPSSQILSDSVRIHCDCTENKATGAASALGREKSADCISHKVMEFSTLGC